jgi:galactokinase
LRPSGGEEVAIYSADLNEEADFDLEKFDKSPGTWGEYTRGVAWALREAGYQPKGWEGTLASDVPVGAGLSSSAAVELAVARAFAEVSGFKWEPIEMAKLAQRAENKWVGVNCGIMDQMISAAGQAGHALMIDCRSLESDPVPIPEGLQIAVLDTSTRRKLGQSAYNERRSQCEEAARILGVPALRDVSIELFDEEAHRLPSTVAKRARHVVTENRRVVEMAEALRRGRHDEIARLMAASHESLRKDYEVSSPELDAIVNAARESPGLAGARMTGAGFGGCAVALVDRGEAEHFAKSVVEHYRRETNLEATVYICEATEGAQVVS